MRDEWKGSKRRNGDMHARVIEVKTQVHFVLSKNFLITLEYLIEKEN